jgi:23S rRNA pseudouridine1911/1915/1917 synthase
MANYNPKPASNAVDDLDLDEDALPEAARVIDLTIGKSEAGMRLDLALVALLPEFSRSRLQAWIKDGKVQVAGTAANPKQTVWGGEAVRITVQPGAGETAFRPEAIPLDVVYEDEAILVINKPAGLVVHPGSGNWGGTLLNGLLYHGPQFREVPRAGIVHRLDKDTSGLLVVAKTLEAQTSLVRQMQARSVKREYLAIVNGEIWQAGTVDKPIGRHASQRTRMAVVQYGGKPAITHFEPLEKFSHCTLIRCRLETGRTHQIRVHMQSLGHPLLGDPVYGSRLLKLEPAVAEAIKAFGRQALHAGRLGLIHPVSGKAMEWHVPMPEDMKQLLVVIRQAEYGAEHFEVDWSEEEDE